MKDDGSTAGGCWIYTGVYADGVNQAARRKPGTRAVLGGAGVGLGLADEPPDPLQPRLRRPGRQAVERAQGATSGGTRSSRSGPATTCRTSRSTKPPSYRPARGRRRTGGAARRRPVHHAGGRQGLALRADRAAGRADADPLRAAGVPGQQPAVPPAGQPDPRGVPAHGQLFEPLRRRAGLARSSRTCSPPTG